MKIIFTLALCLFFTIAAFAQQTKRVDHLTVEEDDLVHETQEIDRRTEIFIKAIDRRFLALSGATAEDKAVKKDEKKWGALPTGTRLELLEDVESILNEAVRNIDNAADRDAKNPALPKSLKMLAEACARYLAALQPMTDKATSERERETIYDATQAAQEVIDAHKSNGEKSDK